MMPGAFRRRFMRDGVLLAVACAGLNLHAGAAPFRAVAPLLRPPDEWRLGSTWQPGKAAGRDFLFAHQGPYQYLQPEFLAKLRQVGFLDRTISGHWNFDINLFDPARRTEATAPIRRLLELHLQQRWPVHTIQYHVVQGRPAPTEAAIQALGDLWLGDDHPEAPIYRLEPVFHYLRTGEKWEGSSMGSVNAKHLIAFFQDRLMPRLEKELPFCRDAKHQWTRPELRRLCDLYCEEYAAEAVRLVAWGMYLSPYHLAALPNTTTIGEKGADAFSNAHGRGLIRQSGGGRTFFVWRGHEPTERYAYLERGWYSIDREEWGYPLPHLWYYLFRPYLMGANYLVVEGMPATLYQDIEADGQCERSTLGHIAAALLAFTERYPDRGIPYAPVGLLMEYTRDYPSIYHTGGSTYSSCRLPYDDADHMNHGVLCDLLFPEHRHTAPSGCYSRTAPFGEIFDILSPNLPGRPIDPKVLDGYKVLFALGGQQIEADYARVLRQYLEAGGTLVINVRDLGGHLDPAMFGVALQPGPREGTTARCVLDGTEFAEAPFRFEALELRGAEPLYTSGGLPLVTKHACGRGTAVLVGVHYLIQSQETDSRQGMANTVWKKKPVLTFAADLLAHLTAGLTPFEVRCHEADREDLSWLVNRRGDGWALNLFNYSLRREELVTRPLSTAKVITEYPYREVPFEIVCRAPTADVVERYGERDVDWSRRDGAVVVAETIRGGDVRVYEFQPGPIELPARPEFVNYALGRPVTASSTLKGYSPQAAVDGRLNNDDFWQSDLDQARHYVLDLPQWLQVDLQEERTIDHAFVLFHYWPHQSLETRLHIYRYTIEASRDGQQWAVVLDESRNEDPADANGLERWFEPTPARYVRLKVMRNTALSGAQVVELRIMGPDKTSVRPVRQSIRPAWQVQYPAAVRDAAGDKRLYLIDLKPKKVQPGWLPAGKTWPEMNGTISLLTDNSGKGGEYAKSLYGESVSELVYDIPAGSKTFVSAIGLGCRSRQASVVFKVLVDGTERYCSPLYRFGERVLPVVVDVAGAKELTLIVTDGGDGINNDYAWWGEAHFIRE